jgi:hypothetical protein
MTDETVGGFSAGLGAYEEYGTIPDPAGLPDLALRRALGRLPSPGRRIVTGHFIDGYPLSALATRLGLSETETRAELARTLSLLSTELRAEERPPEPRPAAPAAVARPAAEAYARMQGHGAYGGGGAAVGI